MVNTLTERLPLVHHFFCSLFPFFIAGFILYGGLSHYCQFASNLLTLDGGITFDRRAVSAK